MEYAIGRRKASVARVYISKGKGEIMINGREIKEYFPQPHIRYKVMEPLEAVDVSKEYTLKVNVYGGGFKGQAEAIRLGIARVLVKVNEEFKPAIKAKRLLTRDARVVERKKYGKPKARKSFQFSKR